MSVIDIPEWTIDAVCASIDPELWFPEKGANSRDAKKLCATCPVRQECLDWAMANAERYGVWGGLSERERRAIGYRQACRACGASMADSASAERYCSDECRRSAHSRQKSESEKALNCIQCGTPSAEPRCRDCQHRHRVSQVMTRAETKAAAA